MNRRAAIALRDIEINVLDVLEKRRQAIQPDVRHRTIQNPARILGPA